MVVDGEKWRKGRGLVRGAFESVHVRNLGRLGVVEARTVDLMPLFKKLVGIAFVPLF